MKPFFVGLALTAPTVAVLAYFSLQGRQEIRDEHQETKAERKVENAKFDAEFDARWNHKPVAAPTKAEIAALEKERDDLKEQHKAARAQSEEDLADLRDSMEIASGEKKPTGATNAEAANLRDALQKGARK